ncbi:protein SPT2 homolog [Indicator indicator]|uniref:protein SPT2 homolog n=1 Tax=Indicator indicator TaxID=1002788 RepID=UPI0023DEEC78|nr:protein SPT2 homolog [Indicator indicator]
MTAAWRADDALLTEGLDASLGAALGRRSAERRKGGPGPGQRFSAPVRLQPGLPSALPARCSVCVAARAGSPAGPGGGRSGRGAVPGRGGGRDAPSGAVPSGAERSGRRRPGGAARCGPGRAGRYRPSGAGGGGGSADKERPVARAGTRRALPRRRAGLGRGEPGPAALLFRASAGRSGCLRSVLGARWEELAGPARGSGGACPGPAESGVRRRAHRAPSSSLGPHVAPPHRYLSTVPIPVLSTRRRSRARCPGVPSPQGCHRILPSVSVLRVRTVAGKVEAEPRRRQRGVGCEA